MRAGGGLDQWVRRFVAVRQRRCNLRTRYDPLAMARYLSWIMVPAILVALLGGLTFIAALSGDDRPTDAPLAMLVGGLAVALLAWAWQAEHRRRARITR